MCVTPWDNGLAERINGVIKNNYLVHWNIHSFDKLLISVDRAVELYNYKKPHIKLKRLTPVEYEKTIFATCTSNQPRGIGCDRCKDVIRSIC